MSEICEHLQAVTSGQITKLLINIPPGCSKSLLVSVFWPCWEWALNPSMRWFFASYDQRLSTRDSVKCRALINSRWYQSLWGGKYKLTNDQNQKTFFETSKQGYRLASSVGGHGTGEHPGRPCQCCAVSNRSSNRSSRACSAVRSERTCSRSSWHASS